MRRTAALLLIVLSRHDRAARAQAPDWTALSDEALHNLSDYIKVNTTNPPGNELRAARFLKRILDKEGIEATDPRHGRAGPPIARIFMRGSRGTAPRKRSRS